MSTDPLFGWDLTFKTVEKDIKSKSDVLIAFIHWNLTKRGFRSIGIGDERTLSGDEAKSELLPTAWNDNNNNYTLRYVIDGKLYLLHGLVTDGNIIINLMRSDDLAVSNIALNIENTVHSLSGSIDKLLPDYKELMHNIKRDLIDNVCKKATSSTETQTKEKNAPGNRRPQEDPLRIPPRCLPAERARPGSGLMVDPFSVGRSDLDPFAPPGIGGGMIFDPFQANRRDLENPGLGIPGGLPRGAVPPGARFDPFGPVVPNPGNRPRPPPDADHLPPPGYDDMFM